MANSHNSYIKVDSRLKNWIDGVRGEMTPCQYLECLVEQKPVIHYDFGYRMGRSISKLSAISRKNRDMSRMLERLMTHLGIPYQRHNLSHPKPGARYNCVDGIGEHGVSYKGKTIRLRPEIKERFDLRKKELGDPPVPIFIRYLIKQYPYDFNGADLPHIFGETFKAIDEELLELRENMIRLLEHFGLEWTTVDDGGCMPDNWCERLQLGRYM